MEYQKKIEALKEILEDLKQDVSEYPSFEDIADEIVKLTIHSVVKPLNDTRCEQGQDHDCSCIDVCGIDRKTKI